jgi:hypothetical protein
MIQRINRFSIGQTAKVIGALYALLGLVFIPFYFFASAFVPRQSMFGAGFALVIPIVYGVNGFIASAIACILYNWVAGMVGGIEIQLDDTDHGEAP